MRRPGVAFRHHNGVGSHDYHLISELNNAAYTLAVYASQLRVTPLPARLASGWLPALARRGWLPAGSQMGFPSFHPLMTSSSTRLCLTHCDSG